MPIISTIGRKSPSVRVLFAAIYLVLLAGGLTMLYPFLLMIATSLTGQTDYKEFRLIPRYFHDTEARCTRPVPCRIRTERVMKENVKDTCLAIFRAGLAAVDPREAVKRVLRLSGDDLRVGERSYAPGCTLGL